MEAKEKSQIVISKVEELFLGISSESVVLMDDNDDTLGMYMAQIPFCTAHPMIFKYSILSMKIRNSLTGMAVKHILTRNIWRN